jgi:ketosteroid isomerase-like protein
MNESSIEEYEERLRRAQLNSDVAALERLLDDDLMFTTLDGSVVGKQDDLELHRSGRLSISKMEPSDRHILHLGTVAVVSVQMNAEAVVDGVSSRRPLRYTRVWTQRNDGWRLIAGHMSIAPAKS